MIGGGGVVEDGKAGKLKGIQRVFVYVMKNA